jgi:L-fuconolactonase
MSVVDAHFHIWNPTTRDHGWLAGVPVLDRRFSLVDYTAIARSNGVDQAVLVQVLNDLDETYEFLINAAAHPVIGGVVGWIDLETPDVTDVIAALREAPGGEYLVGIRHLVQAEADPAYLERSTVLRGLAAVADAGLVFDLLVSETQLASALRAVRKVESLSVVLDHGAKPRIVDGPREPWTSPLAELAATQRAQCKVSGFVTEAGPGWTAAAIRPFLDCLLEAFGPERLLFGSDWPVCTLVATFEEVLGLVSEWLAELSAVERSAVMGRNAQRIYGLPGRETLTG